MKIYHNDQLIKTYHVALGFSPQLPKVQERDGKTPEGEYTISYRNKKSQFHLSLKISYPNEKQSKLASQMGYSAGRDIMIHGLGKSYRHLGKDHIKKDWTDGCIAVTDEEIEEIFPSVEVGTKIDIRS